MEIFWEYIYPTKKFPYKIKGDGVSQNRKWVGGFLVVVYVKKFFLIFLCCLFMYLCTIILKWKRYPLGIS